MSAAYNDAVGVFLDDMLLAGKAGDLFDEAVELLAAVHDVTLDDGNYRQALDKFRFGQTQQFVWTKLSNASIAGAVTSGGTNVLITIRRSGLLAAVRVEEVTRDGVPWRVLGYYPTVNAAIDMHGLTAPKQAT